MVEFRCGSLPIFLLPLGRDACESISPQLLVLVDALLDDKARLFKRNLRLEFDDPGADSSPLSSQDRKLTAWFALAQETFCTSEESNWIRNTAVSFLLHPPSRPRFYNNRLLYRARHRAPRSPHPLHDGTPLLRRGHGHHSSRSLPYLTPPLDDRHSGPSVGTGQK